MTQNRIRVALQGSGLPISMLSSMILGALLCGCGSAKPRPEDGLAQLDGVPRGHHARASTAPARRNIWRRYRGDGLGNDPLEAIPVELKPRVEYWIDYFARRRPEQYRLYIRSGERFRDVIEKTLASNGLPADVYYLGMIESGYRQHARSSEGAVGFWQFRKSTARSFGLQLDDYVDERRDPIRSTHAAARYLRRLRASFGDWYLAIAAYNAGDGRIRDAIDQGGTRDYWTLCDRDLLPRETQDYVPKFLAAMIIGRSAGQYGFTIPASPRRWPEVEKVSVPSPVSLRHVARAAGVSYAEIRRINRHIKTAMTPPNGGTYQVWIPRSAIERFRASRKQLLLAQRADRARS